MECSGVADAVTHPLAPLTPVVACLWCVGFDQYGGGVTERVRADARARQRLMERVQVRAACLCVRAAALAHLCR